VRDIRKGRRRMNMVYESEKMRLVETILRRGRGNKGE
jgi:hypothetical protein